MTSLTLSLGRSVSDWACVFALVVIPLVGCTDVVELQTYSFALTESLPDLTTSPSEGVEICEVDADNCVTSDSSGRAELDVRSNREVTFTFEKEGYGKWVVGDVSDENYESLLSRRMYPDDQLMAIAEQLGTPYPWEGGVVGLVRIPSDVAGVKFAPVESTVGAVGESFYYDSATDEYSLDLEATTAHQNSWLLPLGAGGFTEVTPGERQFEFGGTAVNCGPSWAWPGDGPNQIRVPVRDGYRTYGSMACD